MKKEKDTILKINHLKNRYVTDGNIWTVDETMFNESTYVFLVINIKPRAILGYGIGHKEISTEYIVELYNTILDNYPLKDQNPRIVHSDTKCDYFTKDIVNVFKEEDEDTEISVSIADKDQTQVLEAINNQIKYNTIWSLLEEGGNSIKYRNLMRIQPDKFKHQAKRKKAADKEYRKWFFNSEYFKENAQQSIIKAIESYNGRKFSEGITRKETEYYNTKINPTKELLLVKSSDDLANKVKRLNTEAIQQVKIELTEIIQSEKCTEEKLATIQALVLKQGKIPQDMLVTGFSTLWQQNQEIIYKNENLENQLTLLHEQITELTDELERVKHEERAKENRKQARFKRKRLPKREPITLELYEQLITSIPGYDYRSARRRIAILILTITGIRVNELLPLKMDQIITLINSYWIAMDRSKRGSSSHKAYLTPLGKKLVKERKRDFELVFLTKEKDDYVFTSENNPHTPLRRDTITKEINKILRNLSEKLPTKPNIKTHSFRISFIRQLWKDTQDIEFVKQAITNQ